MVFSVNKTKQIAFKFSRKIYKERIKREQRENKEKKRKNMSSTSGSSSFVQQCLDILKRDDVKQELKSLWNPLVQWFGYEFNIYYYTFLACALLHFIIILAILCLLLLLLRNKNGNFLKF